MSYTITFPDGVKMSSDAPIASAPQAEAPVASPSRGNFRKGQGGRNQGQINGTETFLALSRNYDLARGEGSFASDFGTLIGDDAGPSARTRPNTDNIRMVVEDVLIAKAKGNYPDQFIWMNRVMGQETKSEYATGPRCNVVNAVVCVHQPKNPGLYNDHREALLALGVESGQEVEVKTRFRILRAKTVTEEGVVFHWNLYVAESASIVE